MNSEKEYMIVRSHGKTYFGEWSSSSNRGINLKNAVELITVIMPGPAGLRKNVTVSGIDYCSGATEHMCVHSVSLSYTLSMMEDKDAANLLRDYEEFMNKDNLVQVPPKPAMVKP